MYCTSACTCIDTYSMQNCIQTKGGPNQVLQNEEPYVQAELNDMKG